MKMNNRDQGSLGSGNAKIDYKNVQLLKRYTSDTGKILPRRITMVTAKQQRQLAKAIKTARTMALLPYTSD